MRVPFVAAAIAASLYALLFPSGGWGAAERGVALRVADTGGREMMLYRESHALVIGVSDYTAGWPDLPGVRDDVDAVAAMLEAQGFRVTTLLDPTYTQLTAAYRDFINRHGGPPDNRLLFYFAGHGHTLKTAWGGEMGYVVPADAPHPERDPAGFKARALDMQQMEVYARRIDAKHALFVFDACFSGSLFALSRAIPAAIGYKTARPVRQFITSGTADETVPDQSVFRRQLVAALQGRADGNGDGYVTGGELGEYLQDRVTNYTYDAQHPQYGKIRDPLLDEGDFVFQVGPTSSAAPPPPPPVQAAHVGGVQVNVNVPDAAVTIAGEAAGRAAPGSPVNRWGVAAGEWAQVTVALEKALPPVTLPLPVQPQGEPRPGQVWTDPTTGMDLVWVPGGTFEMGCGPWTSDCDDDERPTARVTLDGFWIGKHEVTQAQWRTVMGEDPSHFKGDDRPVERVSWEDAQRFIERLNARSARTFALPSEAQWEYACRSGGQPERYSGGGDADRVAWYGGNSDGETHEVGSRAANGLGIHDMSGNVWEWVQDAFAGGYAHLPDRSNPLTTQSGDHRVNRGGGWDYEPRYVRCAERNAHWPGYAGAGLGLRLLRK